MKKLFTLVCTLLLGASLSFAQATGGSTDTGKPTTKGKKHNHGGKKGGKKHKKGDGSTTTPPPK
jgi:hypothetical protein